MATEFGAKEIWISNDSGATWTKDTSYPADQNWRGITMSSDGTKIAAVVKSGNIWTKIVSSTGLYAHDWTENTSIGSTKEWDNGFAMSADGRNIVAGSVWDGNIWTSSDSGATWTERTIGDGSNKWMSISSSSDGTKLAALVYEGNIWISSNSGATWTENTSTGAGKQWRQICSSSDGTD